MNFDMEYADYQAQCQAEADAEYYAEAQAHAEEAEYYAMLAAKEYEETQNLIEKMRYTQQTIIDRIEIKKQEIQDYLNELSEIESKARSYGFIL